jgi:V/A-type H+-transporting ATPase subunit I
LAIEKMKIVCMIGKHSDMSKAARLTVLNGNLHLLNALSELNSNNLNLSASQEHMQTLQELAHLRPFASSRDFSKDEMMLKAFQELFNLKPEICEACLSMDYEYDSLIGRLKAVHERVSSISEEIRKKNGNMERLQKQLINAGYLRNIGAKLEQLRGMSFIQTRLMMLSNESFRKLELNIENIPSVVLRTAAVDGNTIVAVFTPKELAEEAERIFASLNYKELELPQSAVGNAAEAVKQLQMDIDSEMRAVEELKRSVIELKNEYESEVVRAYTLMQLEKKAEKIMQDAAMGHNMFFILGFMPVSEIEAFQKQLHQSLGDNILLVADDVKDSRSGHAPPTKIKNSWLIRPFETLISMYGTPSYGEKDPTPFFAVSYMLLFGAMFGDLGQGLVILLGGLLVGYKTANKSFGGILARLGLSSMLFGALYGSIFGSEELIEPLLIRPMANINTMLVGAVAMGTVLITVSYLYSLMNNYSSKNIEEGLFGREGLAGFLFFLTLIFTIWSKATGKMDVGLGLPMGIMAVLLLLMVFKQPLSGLLTGHRLYDDSAGDYYVEAGFGILETVLSVASNVISFIRVGAFALNHVGLYIAFATMAEMLDSRAGSILVLVIGNIIIIGLEGLIVFIQSLRLEYYELFSKYYSGYGVEYRPIALIDKSNNDII